MALIYVITREILRRTSVRRAAQASHGATERDGTNRNLALITPATAVADNIFTLGDKLQLDLHRDKSQHSKFLSRMRQNILDYISSYQ